MNDVREAALQWQHDYAGQGIFTTDTKLRIQSWNRWLEINSGYKAADVIGQSVLEVYSDLVTRRLDRTYQHALEGQAMVLSQRFHHYLLPMDTEDGSANFTRMQQSARIAPLMVDGQIVGTITIIEDVTEREQREHELHRQIKTLEALYEVSQNILSLDLTECLHQLVRTTSELFHAPTVAVVMRADDQLRVEVSNYQSGMLDPNRVNLSNSAALVVIRSGHPYIMLDSSAKQSLALLNPASQSVVATPLIADGNVIGALVVESPEPNAFSLADQRHVMMLATQAAISIRNAQLYRSAQQAIQVRDTFLSIASHELKTPLTTILGHAQMLQRRSLREGNFSDRDKRALSVVAAQSARLNRMIVALLDISRIQTGQLSIDRAPLDLGQLAQRVVDDFQPMLDQHHVVLSVPDEVLIVEGDELRLEQVLQNLLQNAVKYSPQGGAVLVQVSECESNVCLSVTDEGIGIPEEALPRLFSRFYRAENAQERKISGMGIGLFVVREIVELHGGRVEVTSQEGIGSTFTLVLPRAPE
jgi:PAS domain S-box-containing protein